MYNAVNSGDIDTLKQYNNMMWAILALIFAGVIPGIMLLISFGPINELGQAPAPAAYPPPPPPTLKIHVASVYEKANFPLFPHFLIIFSSLLDFILGFS